MPDINLAGCVIVNDGKILLLHRIKNSKYELPGGKIRDGEQPEEAAIRELKEEIGCDVEIIREIGAADFYSNGRTMNYTWFLANIISGKPRICEPDTHDHFNFIPIKELEKYKYKLSENMQNLLIELSRQNIMKELENKRISLD